MHRGEWPASRPVGGDASALATLPRMLALLARHGDAGGGVRATFFAEAWSLAVYPAAVEALRGGGHEVAWHGFQHETWTALDERAERESFARSWERAAQAGVKYDGFRPPGGEINDRTWRLLREHGVKYVSPLGELGVRDGVAVLPFEWPAVDAFYYMDKFAAIRKAHGRGEEVLSPAEFRDYLLKKVDDVVSTGGYMSVLFHPFLQTSEERFAVMEEVLERIANTPEIWCAPCGKVADWVLEHRDDFPSEYS